MNYSNIEVCMFIATVGCNVSLWPLGGSRLKTSDNV